MDENEITQRLRDTGDQPVPGEVRSSHLSQMHAATPAIEKPKRFGRLAVAAAAFAGFAVGSTGLAMAGALPDPAQQVAHDVLAVVQVDVDNPRNRGQCISGVARSDMGAEQKVIEKQACKDTIKPGRPDHAGEGKGNGRPDGVGRPEGHPNDDGDECTGRPPWAGKSAPAYTAEEKAAFNVGCGRGQDDGPEELDVEDEVEAEAEAIEPAEPEEQAPPAEQRQADPQGNAPEGAPQGPPADAPGPPDEGTTPLDVPAPPEAETNTETDTEAG